MSFYSDASLVFIPSGYKASKAYSAKPTDGTGDLTFTRSNDTATRVGPDGLIEKVRTNLILQSEDFTTSWSPNAAPTITANTTVAPDGTTTADTIASSGASSGAYQVPTVASGVEYSFSVYVKNITSATNIQIGCDLTPSNGFLNFNAVTGAITSTAAGITGSSVTDAGNGWYRVSGTYVSTAAANTFIVFGQSGMTFAVWGAQLEAGVTTDYIATTSAAVSVGPVANVPRLDYLGSSCPRLILEPQRTNLVTYSEQFDNAAWSKNNQSVTANTSVSPDGYANADTILSTAASPQLISPVITFGAATNVSVFVKYVSQEWVQLASGGAINDYINFNVQTGAVGTIGSTASNAKVENYGNGWSRISATFSGYAGSTTGRLGFVSSGTAGWLSLDTAFNKSVLAYGWQIEAGAYATSYIPTLGAAVTRGADAASKTSASALIGTSAGTIFIDCFGRPTDSNSRILTITGGAEEFLIFMEPTATGNIGLFGTYSGLQYISIGGANDTRYKIAYAWSANNYALYVNGVAISLTQSASVYSALDRIDLNQAQSGAEKGKTVVNQFISFPVRLSNSDLAALTA